MTTLVVGATGATGRLLVDQLLKRGRRVKAIVRSPDRLPVALRDDERFSVVCGTVLEFSDRELAEHVRGCDAVASCLGHTLSLRGIFGPPYRLVTDSLRRLCTAIQANAPAEPVRCVLMNTAGNRNGDLDERVSFGERCVLGLLRLLVPPHADNERAADFLRVDIGADDPHVEWCAVRPDSLVDEADVTPYEVHPSPTRSAIFNAGKTSRVNVAHFMAALIDEAEAWREWNGRMPVIYNVNVAPK